MLLSWYRKPADMQMLRKIYRERRPLLQPLESFNILDLARAQALLDGDMAEVGVYQGSSARLICSAKGSRSFWGFDTFTGLADVSEKDTHQGVRFFRPGHFRSDYNSTLKYLDEFQNVQLVKGYFPQSAGDAAERKFSFVHLDRGYSQQYSGQYAILLAPPGRRRPDDDSRFTCRRGCSGNRRVHRRIRCASDQQCLQSGDRAEIGVMVFRHLQRRRVPDSSARFAG